MLTAVAIVCCLSAEPIPADKLAAFVEAGKATRDSHLAAERIRLKQFETSLGTARKNVRTHRGNAEYRTRLAAAEKTVADSRAYIKSLEDSKAIVPQHYANHLDESDVGRIAHYRRGDDGHEPSVLARVLHIDSDNRILVFMRDAEFAWLLMDATTVEENDDIEMDGLWEVGKQVRTTIRGESKLPYEIRKLTESESTEYMKAIERANAS